MALNDGLARFRLQQERNQPTLSTIAATKAAASSATKSQQRHPAPAPATKPPPPAPAAVRFSDDITRLQKINQVRTFPAGKQVRDVIALLEATREALTAQQINEKTKTRQHPAPAPATKPPSQPPSAVRFSDDIARLQKINQVRTSPAGKQVRDVIALLERTSEALTARQINERTYVDIGSNSAVAESLRNNAKVRFDGKRYSYKRTHGIKGKDELLSLVGSFPNGLPASEVEGAYPSVLEDPQALKSSGDIYLLSVERDMIAYPNNPRSRMEVDAELKKMFHKVKLPQDMLDIEKELRKNGEKPATDTAKRRAAEQIHGRQPEPEKAKKKPRGITSRTKLTNVHLPGLFDLPVDKDSKDFI